MSLLGKQGLLQAPFLLLLLADDVVHVVVVTAKHVPTGNLVGGAAATHVALAQNRMNPKVGVLVAHAGAHLFNASQNRFLGLGLDAGEPEFVDFLGR